MALSASPRTFRKIALTAAIAAAGTVALPSTTHAATFIYTAPGGTTADNWSTSPFWSPTAPVSDPSTSLIFGNGTTTSGTIATTNDVANPFQLNSMLVDYNGSAAITLNIGGSPLQFVNNGAIAPTLTISNTGSATTLTIANQIILTNNTAIAATTAGTFTGGFTGAGNLTKSGPGTVTLSTTASGNTGTDSIASGTLALNFNVAGAPTTNLLDASSALSMAGVLSNNPVAALTATGRKVNLTNNIQTFAGATFGTGRSLLTASITTGATDTVTVNLSTLTRNVGGTAIFNPGASTNFTTTSSNDLSGILGAWATIGSSFATNSGTLNANAGGTGGDNIVAYTGYADIGTTQAIGNANPDANILVSNTDAGATVTLAASGTTDVNTVSVTDTTVTGTTIDLGGNTLRFGAVGALWRDNTTADNVITVQNGNITAGGAANTSGELILRNDKTGSGTFVVDLVVSANLVDNGTGVLAVTKTGAQGAKLTGTNTYTGNTYITQGSLQATAAEGFGTGSIYVYGDDDGQAYGSGASYDNQFFIAGSGPVTKGTSAIPNAFGAIRLGSSTILTGKITLLGDAAIGGGASANPGQIEGQITGSFGLNFGAGGQNSGAFIILDNTSVTNPNNYTGDTTIVGAGSSASGNSVITLGASEQIPNGPGAGNLVLAPGGTGGTQTSSFNLNGFSETINGLNSGGTGTDETLRLVINSATTTASTLTLGDSNANATFRGEMKNGGTGTLSITKIGTGDQVLSGVNAYTGATTITAGTLEINNQGGTTTGTPTDGRLGGATAITISGGQLLLSGSNTNSDRLNDTSTINLAGGTLNLNGLSEVTAGGNGVGVLTVSANSHIDFGVGSTNAVVQFAALPVHIPGTSTLTIDDWNGTAGVANTGGDQLLFAGAATDFSSVFNQSDVTFTGFGTGYTVIQNAGYYEVVAGGSTPAPEPASVALLGLGALGLVRRRRRSA